VIESARGVHLQDNQCGDLFVGLFNAALNIITDSRPDGALDIQQDRGFMSAGIGKYRPDTGKKGEKYYQDEKEQSS